MYPHQASNTMLHSYWRDMLQKLPIKPWPPCGCFASLTDLWAEAWCLVSSSTLSNKASHSEHLTRCARSRCINNKPRSPNNLSHLLQRMLWNFVWCWVNASSDSNFAPGHFSQGNVWLLRTCSSNCVLLKKSTWQIGHRATWVAFLWTVSAARLSKLPEIQEPHLNWWCWDMWSKRIAAVLNFFRQYSHRTACASQWWSASLLTSSKVDGHLLQAKTCRSSIWFWYVWKDSSFEGHFLHWNTWSRRRCSTRRMSVGNFLPQLQA